MRKDPGKGKKKRGRGGESGTSKRIFAATMGCIPHFELVKKGKQKKKKKRGGGKGAPGDQRVTKKTVILAA